MSAKKPKIKKFRIESLETERLLLRPLRMSDAAAIFAYASDPEVSRNVRFRTHRKIAESRAFLRFVMKRYRSGAEPVWGIELKADRRVIGSIGMVDWRRNHRRAEMGYALHRDSWDRGIATEAARAVVAFGFVKMDLNRIEAGCYPQNPASARVLEKCGFKFEGMLRQHEYIKGKFRDARLYSLLREEFFHRRVRRGR